MTTIEAKYLRGALAAASPVQKKDPRKYLTGVHLDVSRGRIVGTDGHLIYVAKNVPLRGAFEDDLTLEPFKLPVKAEQVDFTRLGEGKYQVTSYCKGNTLGTPIVVSTIGGPYPHYERVFENIDAAIEGGNVFTARTNAERAEVSPEVGSDLMPVTKDLAIDLRLIARIAAIMPSARLEGSGRGRLVYFSAVDQPDEIIGIMPLHGRITTNSTLPEWKKELNGE